MVNSKSLPCTIATAQLPIQGTSLKNVEEKSNHKEMVKIQI
jgi:hypothetical protein